MRYLILYLLACLVLGIFGMNRKLGFWGYFFISFLVTPFAGVLMFFASEPKRSSQDTVADAHRQRRLDQQRRARNFGIQRAVDDCTQRVARLVASGVITQEYASELGDMVSDLPSDLTFDEDGSPSSNLHKMLRAMESVKATNDPATVGSVVDEREVTAGSTSSIDSDTSNKSPGETGEHSSFS